MNDPPREWAERWPTLFTAITSLTAAAGMGFVWWRHPESLQPGSLVIVGLLLALPVVNTIRTVRKSEALAPEHAVCAREMVNGALKIALFMLASFAIFTGILLDCAPACS